MRTLLNSVVHDATCEHPFFGFLLISTTPCLTRTCELLHRSSLSFRIRIQFQWTCSWSFRTCTSIFLFVMHVLNSFLNTHFPFVLQAQDTAEQSVSCSNGKQYWKKVRQSYYRYSDALMIIWVFLRPIMTKVKLA